MTEEIDTSSFDPKEFIDSLISEMGMADREPEELAEIRGAIEQQMNHIVLKTTAIYLEPEVIDEVLEEQKDTEDFMYLVSRFIKFSPRVQLAIYDELDEFKEQTLEAFNILKT
ncbi:hypothetical protein KJ742_02830 [Patescibacteria group bacterium]|nr:hypothetical protein [Patescibacteria group bacterium]MBU1682855.1 hypothetical protein [Patescibacteria group bacterium]MBU1934492.1 hypothetical protein [Patescibacteria group bacterium]